VAALLEPMIEKAVRSAASREFHRWKSNGGPPEAADTPSDSRHPS
jgi:hypothetical protein